MSENQIEGRNFITLTGPLKTACSFCRTKTTDELKLGQVYSSDGLVVHYFCLLTASSLPQNGEDDEGVLGFHLTDIRNEVKVSATRPCAYCKKKGASVRCCKQKCRLWFHLTCGRKNDSLHQFFGRFKSFCRAHRPKQKVDEAHLSLEGSSKILCPICYEDVDFKSLDILWAPCCKKNAWFHRDCVQKLALSAGYFFKCPLCNNEAVFKETMEKFGIYIPQRDALWEQVPNAYQELLYQYRRCDAEECKCPRGRTHNGESNWELVRCKTCGSQGVHISCGRLKFSAPEWICQSCKDVLKSEAIKKRLSVKSRSASSTRRRSPPSASRRSLPAEPARVPQELNLDPQLSSSSDSNGPPSRNQLKRNNGRFSRVSKTNPSIPTSNVDSIPCKPEVVPNSAVNNPPIKRCKPCPKRFKKDYVDYETGEKSIKNETKTETSVERVTDTSISLLKEHPIEEPRINILMAVESDSDEEIEVLEVHRVLERKSLTTGDGTTLEVHLVPEKQKVLYEIRDVEASSSSGSAGTEVLPSTGKPPVDKIESITPSSSPPVRSLDPKLFYKPTTSSVEKCDRLTEETSGSHQSVIIQNFEAQIKSSGCQFIPVCSQPKTTSAAAEGKNSLSNPDRIPVKSFPETVATLVRPVPLNSDVTSSVTQQSYIKKPNLPARGNFIEEITIIDEPSQNAPSITKPNHPQSFQPQIVNVTSGGNLPNNGPVPRPEFRPALIGPMVPIIQQTGPALHTNNYILCTTGLWIPTSDSGFMANMAVPTNNTEPQATMSQPPPRPTMSFDPMETNLNIKISDVRHSNEFFNSPSNSINTPVNFRMAGGMAGWTALSLPRQYNGIRLPQGHQSKVNILGHQRRPAVSEISPAVSEISPAVSEISPAAPGHYPQPSKPVQVFHQNTATPTPGRHRMLTPNSLTSEMLANRLSQPYGQSPTPEHNSAPDVIVLE